LFAGVAELLEVCYAIQGGLLVGDGRWRSTLIPSNTIWDAYCGSTGEGYVMSLVNNAVTLKVKKQALESEKRVREHEADLLVGYAKTLTGEHVSPAQMGAFLEGFVEQGRKNVVAVSYGPGVSPGSRTSF